MLQTFGMSAKPALKCPHLLINCAPVGADSSMSLSAGAELCPCCVGSRWQQPGCSCQSFPRLWEKQDHSSLCLWSTQSSSIWVWQSQGSAEQGQEEVLCIPKGFGVPGQEKELKSTCSGGEGTGEEGNEGRHHRGLQFPGEAAPISVWAVAGPQRTAGAVSGQV